MRLAYVVDTWPKLSETFVVREIAEAAKRHDVTIVSLTRPEAGPPPPEAEALAGRVVHLDSVPSGRRQVIGSVQVPAGTFDCFKVEGLTFNNWQNIDRQYQGYVGSKNSTTYWYCPAMKWGAKWEIVDAPSGAVRVTTVSELTSFEQK